MSTKKSKETSQNLIKTVEQGRAKFAYERVQKIVNAEESWSSDYKSYLKRIPMLIKTNGLAATIAFILKKDSAAYKRIYEDCTEWIKKDPKRVFNLDDRELIKYILDLDSSEYRAFTSEILSFIKWMSRFANGMIN
ncbi:MAG: type III-B CRISPR module-associated protein Cmr5 [Candidatus Lokiarchaeota archaeon]|nr:type III-B CRISPR module-associated protein Cmr5 [Candidatus Lokiarchaeota archaeon]